MKRCPVSRCLQSAVALLLCVGAAAEPVRFAVIGDFGAEKGAGSESKVAAMVKAWKPDFIVTVGDNAYSDHNGHQNAFQKDVLSYYGDYIKSPVDDPDGTQTRFFPTLGNHDYAGPGGGIFQPRFEAYQKAFAVPKGPGGHHYYEFARGPVRFFALDSNNIVKWNDVSTSSAQFQWLTAASAKAKERWKFAVFHHSPYVSGTQHSTEIWMRDWKLETMGLTAIIAGHEHVYERVMKGSVPFVTNGLGGDSIYPFAAKKVDGSTVRYGRKEPGETNPGKYRHGALFGEATEDSLTLEFWTASGQRKDHWPEDAPPLTRNPQAVP